MNNQTLLVGFLVISTLWTSLASAAPVHKAVSYEVGNTSFEGVIVYDDAVKTPRPGLVMVPNWLGVTEASVKQASEIAGQKYVVFVADVYGKDVRPKNFDQAAAAATAVKSDRPLMRARVAKAVEVLKAQAKSAPIDVHHLGAIGFCFGGTTVLELARSGAQLAGFVLFYGGLDTPTPQDAAQIKGRILVLRGADDPSVPGKVLAFQAEMRAGKADWQLVAFGGAVHSFTDPDANMPGRAQYHPAVAKPAFALMDAFFAELFAPATR